MSSEPPWYPPSSPVGHQTPPAFVAARPQARTVDSTDSSDRRLMIGGIICVALSVVGVGARMAGLVPSGVATAVVLAVAATGLRLYVSYAAKSASSARRARVTRLLSMIGLGVSAITVLASLPVITRTGGSGHFFEDLVAHVWSLVLLTVAVASVRTLGWRTLFGMCVTGFLAVSGIAFSVGHPVVTSLGQSSVFATAIWAPVTEEILKALPVLLILIFAVRRTNARPSAVEMALLGAWIGAGFALYEDTQFGRGGFSFSAMPPFSFLWPSATNDSGHGITYAVAGHMVWTALISLGLGVSILYRHQHPKAWLAAPVATVVALCEHFCQNDAALLVAHLGNSAAFDLLRILTLDGWLSSILLVAALFYVARFERRALYGTARNNLLGQAKASLWLSPALAGHVGAELARLQLTRLDPSKPAGVTR